MFDANLVLVQLTRNNNPLGILKMFVGAGNFLKSEKDNWIRFRFKGYSKANMVTITLTPADLYKVEFGKVVNKVNKEYAALGVTVKTPEYKTVEVIDGVYAEDLKEIFESTTGLFLSM